MTNPNLTLATVRAISDRLRGTIRGLEVTHDGATAKPADSNLSHGCLACKSGAWICIYIGVSCNLKCNFCPQLSRHNEAEYIWANGGDHNINSKEELDRQISINPRISGISFSGGEPFKYLDLIYEWMSFIKTRDWYTPDLYFWIYTNGTLVTEEEVRRLAKAGINEIRFDLASTNFADKIMAKIPYCKKHLDKVSVEVPSLYSQLDRIIEVLPFLEESGVDYLNLHQLQVSKDNFERATGELGVNTELVYQNLWGLSFDLGSLYVTYRIIDEIARKNYKIIYNDCSSRHYELQSAGWQYQSNQQNTSFSKETWESFYSRMMKERGCKF